MEDLERLDFSDLSVHEEIIPIGPKKYVLREANGEAVMAHTNARAANIQYANGEVSRFTGVATADVELLSACLFVEDEKTPGQFTNRVQRGTINSWPARVQEALVKRCKLISKIDTNDTLESLIKQRDALDKKIKKLQAEETERKNSSSGTTAGSS